MVYFLSLGAAVFGRRREKREREKSRDIFFLPLCIRKVAQKMGSCISPLPPPKPT